MDFKKNLLREETTLNQNPRLYIFFIQKEILVLAK